MDNYKIISKEEAVALTGWSTDLDHVDEGPIAGLLRGYNLEVVRTSTGLVDFCDSIYIYGDLAEYVNDPSYDDYLYMIGVEPTGRAIFRGYYKEYVSEGELCVELIQ